VEDSKLDVGVSEITDGGLLGVNGILDGTALDFDDGVAGIGGMPCEESGERSRFVVGRRPGQFFAAVASSGKGRRENPCLRSLSLGKLNQTFLLHAPEHVTQRVLVFRNFSFQKFEGLPRPNFLPGHVEA